MDSYFPFVGSPNDYENTILTEEKLPMLYELDWNFERNEIKVNKDNEINIVKGNKAVKVWCYFAILTDRYGYIINSWEYGTELITLVGQKFTKGVTELEAFRFIREALLINPYILDVEKIDVSFKDDVVTIKIKVISIYGEVIVDVRR